MEHKPSSEANWKFLEMHIKYIN